MKRIHKGKVEGDINIGLYFSVSDRFAIVPRNHNYSFDVANILDVPVIESNVNYSPFNGIFLASNSYGVLFPKVAGIKEIEFVKKQFNEHNIDVNIEVLQSNETVLGNLILCNDKGCVISSTLKKFKKKLEDVFNVEVVEGKIMDLDIVGSLGYATNKGFIISAYALEEEYELIKDVLKVEGDIGTVNYGSPFVKSGIIANSKGLVVGEKSTGIEIGRIAESLGFVE